MLPEKRKRLEAAGWKIGSASDFLNISPSDRHALTLDTPEVTPVPMSNERRQFFRVRYPGAERPEIEIASEQHAVNELSEGGLRVSGALESLQTGEIIEACLQLLSGTTLPITASCSRTEDEESVFEDLQGVSFAEMLNEQRYLIRKYPSVKQDGEE